MGSLSNNVLPNFNEENGRRELVVTQISLGGFEPNVTVKDLSKFLENEMGLIWRCRVKSSRTPPESYPLFAPVPPSADISHDYAKVVPHAFVQFAQPDVAKRALELAGRSELVLDRHVLRASSTNMVDRPSSIDPFRFVKDLAGIGHWAALLYQPPSCI